MYCKYCGKENEENTNYCIGCGAKLEKTSSEVNATSSNESSNSYVAQNEHANQSTNSNYQKSNNNQFYFSNKQPLKSKLSNKLGKGQIMRYIAVVLSAICLILPFCTWLNVPVAQTIGSWFGLQDTIESVTSYSAFTIVGLGTAGSGIAQSDGLIIFFVILIVLLIVPMIFYVVYIILALMKKEKNLKFLLIGAISMIFITIFFMLVIGLLSTVSYNVINMTAVPWINLFLSISNIVLAVLINTDRKQSKRQN